jgi:beta-galactosidase
MIWNEPASYACYCPHTIARFREWLREKYQDDLDKVNELWGTEFPINYQDWSEVQAPTGSGVLNIWRDWMQFNQFRLYDSMEKIDQLVNKNDPKQRPTTANIVYHMAAMEGPVNSSQYGMDLGRVGQTMSIQGVSCYTVEHKYDPGEGYLTAYKLSRLRSVSRDENRRMMVLETGAGPNMKMITEEQRILSFYHLIAHNVKAILVWNYRSRLSDGQVALFNLMKWDGSVSRRGQYMGDFSKMLQENAKLLNNVYPERQAAILTLENEQILMDGLCGMYTPASYESAHDSRFGAYKLLWDMNIPTDCLTECQLSEMNRYPLLLLPLQEHMNAELAEQIRNYVAEGGTVIAESPFAFRSDDGILQYTAPAFGLDEVFGCQTRDREGWETAPEVIYPDGKAEVCFFWNEYTTTTGTAVAKYANGEPAAVVNNFGKGRAILFGTEVFRQYMQNPQAAVTSLLQKEVLASGVEPTAKITEGDADKVEVNRLSGDNDGLVYIIINHHEEKRKFKVELRDNEEWLNLESNEPVDMSKEIELEFKEVLALKKK